MVVVCAGGRSARCHHDGSASPAPARVAEKRRRDRRLTPKPTKREAPMLLIIGWPDTGTYFIRSRGLWRSAGPARRRRVSLALEMRAGTPGASKAMAGASTSKFECRRRRFQLGQSRGACCAARPRRPIMLECHCVARRVVLPARRHHRPIIASRLSPPIIVMC